MALPRQRDRCYVISLKFIFYKVKVLYLLVKSIDMLSGKILKSIQFIYLTNNKINKGHNCKVSSLSETIRIDLL